MQKRKNKFKTENFPINNILDEYSDSIKSIVIVRIYSNLSLKSSFSGKYHFSIWFDKKLSWKQQSVCQFHLAWKILFHAVWYWVFFVVGSWVKNNDIPEKGYWRWTNAYVFSSSPQAFLIKTFPKWVAFGNVFRGEFYSKVDQI